jgi:hypothetical protein
MGLERFKQKYFNMIQAFKRTHQIGIDEKFGVKATVGILKDEPVGVFDTPAKAYSKTAHLEKRDWENGVVISVWFCFLPDKEVARQLSLF